MKVLDLFSGIGGFSLGLERAGFETVAFCEIEEYPRKILKKHWPDVPIYEDVRKLDGKKFRGTVDVICGGFPCQPFSHAGKQKGKEDHRHLWPEMLRLIREVKPTWVIGENVAGFIRMALDDVLLDLENEGYTSQSFVVPACAVGGVHKRDRVWIVAYSKRNTNIRTVGGIDGETEKMAELIGKKNRASRITCGASDGGCSCELHASNTNNERLQRESITGSNEKIRTKPNDKQSTRCSGSQFFRPIEPPIEPPVRHRDDGVPENMARLKALGNAVVPQIPEIIGRAILSL